MVPVAGLRPSRASRSVTSNDPKPVNAILSPLASVSVTISRNVLTAFSASTFLNSVFSVRQLGVRLSNLKYHAEQLSLFEEVQKKSDAIKAMDPINDRFGEFKVTFGSLLSNEEKGSHVISPAWRPDGIRSVDVT